jgi:hypothetical protein
LDFLQGGAADEVVVEWCAAPAAGPRAVGPVGPVTQKQGVVIGVAGNAHEHPDIAHAVGGHEAHSFGVKGYGLFPAGLRDVDRDVAQPDRADPAGVPDRLVPPVRRAGPVERLVLAVPGRGGR